MGLRAHRRELKFGTNFKLTDPLAAVWRLRRARDVLAASGDPDVCAVAAALNAYLDPRATCRLEEVLELAPIGVGAERWRTAARRERRDDALRDLAERFFPGLSISAQAEALGRLIRRYRATAWPRADRYAAAMPSSYLGTVSQYLFAAFAAGSGTVPASGSHLRKVLATHSAATQKPAGRIGNSSATGSVTVRSNRPIGARNVANTL